MGDARYGARYAIDLPELTARLRHQIPVVHLGQLAAIDAVRRATPNTYWLVASVWCDRTEAARRIAARATGDTNARLAAWDETATPAAPDLSLDTTTTTPALAAQTIHGHLRLARGLVGRAAAPATAKWAPNGSSL